MAGSKKKAKKARRSSGATDDLQKKFEELSGAKEELEKTNKDLEAALQPWEELKNFVKEYAPEEKQDLHPAVVLLGIMEKLQEDQEKERSWVEDTDQGQEDGQAQGQDLIGELRVEILDECKKVATNEVSHCYTLVQKTRELIEIEKEKAS